MATCDVCNTSINWTDGYVLATKDVATSPSYWDYAFRNQWSYTHGIDETGDTVSMLAMQQAAQSDGWLICESCSCLFQFDRASAKQYAKRQSAKPPGVGPCDVQRVALAAGQAWQKLYGKWPASIEITQGGDPNSRGSGAGGRTDAPAGAQKQGKKGIDLNARGRQWADKGDQIGALMEKISGLPRFDPAGEAQLAQEAQQSVSAVHRELDELAADGEDDPRLLFTRAQVFLWEAKVAFTIAKRHLSDFTPSSWSENAVDAYEKSFRIVEGDGRAYFELGVMYSNLRKYALALPAYQKAYALGDSQIRQLAAQMIAATKSSLDPTPPKRPGFWSFLRR